MRGPDSNAPGRPHHRPSRSYNQVITKHPMTQPNRSSKALFSDITNLEVNTTYGHKIIKIS